MKKLEIILTSLVLGLLLLAGLVGAQNYLAPSAQIIEDITTEEALALIQDNKDNLDFVILDVRTPEEFSGGHIKDAINLDYFAKTFRDSLDKLDKNKTHLIYCKSGGRSGQALNIMKELHFVEVHNVLGGITKWEADGFPITTAVTPVDRHGKLAVTWGSLKR